MDARDREKVIAKMLGPGLRHGSPGPVAACPEADVLAAYYDHSLSGSEVARWETHFAACERCQHILATLAVSDTQTVAAETQSAKPHQPSWKRLLDWRWMAPAGAAAALALWFIVRPMPLGPPSHGTQPANEEARNIQPTSPAETDLTSRPAIAARKDSAIASGKLMRPASPADRETSTETQEKARASSQPAATGLGRLAPKAPAPERSVREAVGPVRRDEQPLDALGAQPRARIAGTAGRVGPGAEHATAAPKERRESLEASRLRQTERTAPATPQPSEPAMTAPAGTSQVASRAAPDKLPGKPATAGALPAGATASEFKAEEPLQRSAKTQREAVAVAAPAPGRGLDRLQLRSASQPAELVIHSPREALKWRAGAAGKIERSQDAGRTWQAQASGVDTDLLAGSAPSERVCWIVGRAGTILRTTDGERWEKVASPAPADWIHIVARDALHARVRAADHQLYVTSDGGRTWKYSPAK